MTAHTPGPWVVGPRYGRTSIEIQNHSRAVCHVPAFDYADRTTAGAPTGRGEVANLEGFANAALIAAAPDLLAYAECEAAWNDDDGTHDALPTFQRHGFTGNLSKPAGDAFLASLRRTALSRAKGGGK